MIKLNDNADYVKEIKDRLERNNGFCPCSIVKSPDTKCMCKDFREMDEGECHCGLYIKIKDK